MSHADDELLQRYLIEEIAHDHADGLLSRREALRRMALMGLGVSAATGMLAAIPASVASAATKTTKRKTTRRATTKKGTSTSAKAPSTAAPSTTAAPTATAATTPGAATTISTAAGAAGTALAVTFPGPAGQLRGYLATATNARGAVLIVHENRGLTDHFRALPARFAEKGYTALSIDLLSRAGGTEAASAQLPASLSAIPSADLVMDMRSGLDELARRVPGKKLAMTGFCFGGGMVWNFVNTGDARLAAAMPFYGPGPATPDFSVSKGTAVLGVYAEQDARVNASREDMQAALQKAGLTHEIRTFPGVDHAFFNDTGARYDATQAGAAFQAVLDWLGKHVG